MDGEYIDAETLKGGTSAAMAALITGLRTSIVAFTAALGAGIALLYTARTYRLTRRGQITERFTKALERLGSDEVYVRIGGILALEQIVRDAPEQAATDAARVLGHFIRERAPDVDAETRPTSPAADVQEALTALTRPASRTHVDPREPLNLRGLHLVGADLTRADLDGTTLTGASLTRATLTGANLTVANLTGSSLTGANLTKALVSGTTCINASLSGATFTGAFLTGANLTEADLSEASLKGAFLTGANLRKASLTGANLTNASLTGAILTEADLTAANLKGAFLTAANLQEANLTNVVLTKAILHKATLTRVRRLRVMDVCSAVTDGTTELPPWLYPRTDTPTASD
jgi:uncharacterized protein YjbI with pentapeptide repeats